MSSKRGRNWSFIGYPGDSLPENYVEILDGMYLQWAESPVHDKDLNPTGDEKKAHIHFYLSFPGMKSLDQIVEISKKVNGTLPIMVENPRGMIRYFIHADNPEKFQYNQTDIKTHGGLDISDYFKLGQSETRKIICEMIGYIKQYNVNTFRDFVEICYENQYDEWLDILTQKNTMFFSSYLKDRFYIWKQQQEAFRNEN